MEIYIPQTSGSAGGGQVEPDAYTVQPGDTLESIAEQFGMELAELIVANFAGGSGENVGQLSAGQELRIPTDENVQGYLSYTVQQGDTKESIANQFQLGLTQLLRANPQLIKDALLPGSQLRIPQFNSASESQAGQHITLKQGGTLKDIAKQYNVSDQELRKANPHLTDSEQVKPGETLKLPQQREDNNVGNRSRELNSAFALDNLSKLRFQIMDNLPNAAQMPPGFGTPGPMNNEEEGEEGSPRKRQQNINRTMPPPFDKWAEFIYATAEKYQIAASLIAAVIWCESGGNNIIAKNGHGCGLMQIDDRRYGEWLHKNAQGLDPAVNIDFGTSILRLELDYFHGSIKAALAAYNVGRDIVSQAMGDRQDIDLSMPGGRYALDVLGQQEYFRKYFED